MATEKKEISPKILVIDDDAGISAAATGRVMLAAHRDLMELDPRNREKFAPVTELLQKGLKKNEPPA